MASRVPFLLLLCVIPNVIYAFCYRDKIKEMPGPHGLVVPYCEYNGLKLATGSHFEDLVRCHLVNCEKSGLSVCGIGAKAGVVSLPEGCKSVNDLCRFKIIQDTNVTASCPIPTPTPSS